MNTQFVGIVCGRSTSLIVPLLIKINSKSFKKLTYIVLLLVSISKSCYNTKNTDIFVHSFHFYSICFLHLNYSRIIYVNFIMVASRPCHRRRFSVAI
jgi:hypothetical protein